MLKHYRMSFLDLPSGCEGSLDLTLIPILLLIEPHIYVCAENFSWYQTQVDFSVNKTIYKEYKCLYEVLMRNIVRQCGCYPSYVR